MHFRLAHRSAVARLTLAMVLVTLILGCAGPREAPPTIAEVKFQAAPNLNPSITGEAAPLVVRIYELAAAGSFTDSDFFALFDEDRSVLGPDLLGRDELRLVPGAERRVNKTLQPGTRFLGIMAAYREIDQVNWRDVVSLKHEKVNRFTVTLGERELKVSKN